MCAHVRVGDAAQDDGKRGARFVRLPLYPTYGLDELGVGRVGSHRRSGEHFRTPRRSVRMFV